MGNVLVKLKVTLPQIGEVDPRTIPSIGRILRPESTYILIHCTYTRHPRLSVLSLLFASFIHHLLVQSWLSFQSVGANLQREIRQKTF